MKKLSRLVSLTIATAALIVAAGVGRSWSESQDAKSKQKKLKPIPDRLVVMTFDDSVKSHYTVARPILKKYGFGATFYITEGFSFATNKKDYMTWKEIRALHDDGFEIGNHTRDHMAATEKNIAKLEEQLRVIDESCKKAGIPRPTTFAYPGNFFSVKALPVLRKHGIKFARRGGSPEYPPKSGKGIAFEPGKDHPLLIPSACVPRPGFTLEDFVAGVAQAKNGRIAVVQFHGVPEGEHPWVNTPRERFEEFMKYLHDRRYKVIALRDLSEYVDPKSDVEDPLRIINQRRKTLSGLRSGGF